MHMWAVFSRVVASLQGEHHAALRILFQSWDHDAVRQGMALVRTLADPAFTASLAEGVVVHKPTSVSRVHVATDAPLRRLVSEAHLDTIALFLARETGQLDAVEDLHVADRVWSVEPLAGLQRLTNLYIPTPSRSNRVVGLDDLRGLSHLPRLRALAFGSHGFTTLDGLHDLPALEEISLDACSSVGDIHALSGIPSLQTFVLTRNYRLKSLDGLVGLPHLAHIGIHAAGLQDISAVATLPALRTLRLSACKDVQDWAPLRAATGLRTLDAGFEGFHDLPLLEGHPALEVLSLNDTDALRDVRPLLGLPALRKVDLSRCKGLPGTLQRVHEGPVLGRLLAILQDDRVRLQDVVDRLRAGTSTQVQGALYNLRADPDLAARCLPVAERVVEAHLRDHPDGALPGELPGHVQDCLGRLRHDRNLAVACAPRLAEALQAEVGERPVMDLPVAGTQLAPYEPAPEKEFLLYG